MWNGVEEDHRSFGVPLPDAFEVIKKAILEWNARWHVTWSPLPHDQQIAILRFVMSYKGTGHPNAGQKLSAFLHHGQGVNIDTFDRLETRITLSIHLVPYVISGLQHPPSVTANLHFQIQTEVPDKVNYLSTIVSQTVACIFYYLEQKEIELMPELQQNSQLMIGSQTAVSRRVPAWQISADISHTSTQNETRTDYRARLAAMTPQEQQAEKQSRAQAYARHLAQLRAAGKLPDHSRERLQVIEDPVVRSAKIKEWEGYLTSMMRIKQDYLTKHASQEESKGFLEQAEPEIPNRAIKIVRLWYDEDKPDQAMDVYNEWKLPEPSPLECEQEVQKRILNLASENSFLLELMGQKDEAQKYMQLVRESLEDISTEYWHRNFEEKDLLWAEELVKEFEITDAAVSDHMSALIKARFDARMSKLVNVGDEVAAEKLRTRFSNLDMIDCSNKLLLLWKANRAAAWSLALDKVAEVLVDGKQKEFAMLVSLRSIPAWHANADKNSQEYLRILQELGHEPDWIKCPD